MSDLAGKHGLVVGVANKRSISWGIAQALAARGARLALTYQVERLEENVRELAATLENRRRAMRPSNDQQLADLVTTSIASSGIDFVVHGAAFALQADLSNPFVQRLAKDFGLRWM
jgi:enoyl-[acyl-carrier protein] reductase I